MEEDALDWGAGAEAGLAGVSDGRGNLDARLTGTAGVIASGAGFPK